MTRIKYGQEYYPSEVPHHVKHNFWLWLSCLIAIGLLAVPTVVIQFMIIDRDPFIGEHFYNSTPNKDTGSADWSLTAADKIVPELLDQVA